MRLSILFVLVLCSLGVNIVNSLDENCIEQPENCADITEYTAYMHCLDQTRRRKRSAGCTNHQENCEFIDCQTCQESCDTTCEDCECSHSCRQCCSETCTTNLCCHKTCHNQCKTNHCRSECKRNCKQRIYSEDGDHSENIAISSNRNASSYAKHNITTIINLHNIINNTNLIDIPIKINNTNYNNITLKRSDAHEISSVEGGNFIKDESTSSENGKCCSVVGPRQCVKTETYPFMKCFHYRHRRCAPYCVSDIVHAQPQNYCDESGCHQKLFYIPQAQPRCMYQPNWPYVNCGGQQQHSFHNCHGCYNQQPATHATHHDHQHHHTRCLRCYDNGLSSGPLYQQGPYYQPQFFPNQMCSPNGFCGYQQPAPPPFGGGFNAFAGYGGYGGYPGNNGFAGYGGGPQFNPGYNNQGYGQFPMYPNNAFGGSPVGYGDAIYDANSENDLNGNLETKSGDSEAEGPQMINYPANTYIFETTISADKLKQNHSLLNEKSSNPYSHSNIVVKNATSVVKSPTSRYAVISIDSAKDKKEKERRFKRKKDKSENATKNEDKSEELTAATGHPIASKALTKDTKDHAIPKK